MKGDEGGRVKGDEGGRVKGERGRRALLAFTLLGLLGYLFLPFYALEEGFFSFDWLYGYPFEAEGAPAVAQVLAHGRPWLAPILLALLSPLTVAARPRGDRLRARVLVFSASLGLAWMVFQGFAIGAVGAASPALEGLLGPPGARQFGMGAGALVSALALLLVLSEGLATGALGRSDPFVAGALVLSAALVSVFVLYPVSAVLLRAFEREAGGLSLRVFAENLASPKLLEVTWNSLLLALLASAGSTALGLALALAVARSGARWLAPLRLLSVLPVITPPFVIGLALILAFGRSGAVTTLASEVLGFAPSRYIFGLPGLLLAQWLAFTPVAFLVLVGALEAVSPSLEEAAQTLRAGPGRAFFSVTLPLLTPGLANAFLIGFVESLADFGNPLVLGGSDYEVLATEIYFAVAGAQGDVPRAAAMAFVLLALTLLAFLAQRRWTAGARYVTVGGKGDAGRSMPLPRALRALAIAASLAFSALTLGLYGLVLAGGFVRLLGVDNAFTLDHYARLFSVGFGGGPVFSGEAWSSLGETLALAAVAAPLTAALGLLVAYLLERQRFRGRSVFEFATLLSFAVPGTVIGVAYVLAFNVPPIDLVGTGAILVLCFVFRNMPVGIRAGVSALAQVDPSLDEASLTLRASVPRTLWRVLLPLLRPAWLTALVYGFVRAVTAVSAVVFLVSAEHNLATTHILGLVEAGEYGGAIAYSSVLIALLLAAVAGLSALVGRIEIGRRKG